MMEANRRKLIKGSLAAPMIFTLGPATGWAQAINSAGVCLQKSEISVPEAGGAITGDADQWVRVPVPLLQLTLTPLDGQPTQLDGLYIRSYDQQFYYKVQVNNAGTPPEITELKVGQQGLTEQSTGTGYALVRIAKFDENAPAEITGFAWNGGTGAVASFACAGSAGLVDTAAAGLFKIG
jgi:hypothetical protein